jgi:hypothetical protein
MRLLCLTKMKRYSQVCPKGFSHLVKLEQQVEQTLNDKLATVAEQVFDTKDELSSETYLGRMNQLSEVKKSIDHMNHISEIDEV